MYREIITPNKHNRIIEIPKEYWNQEVEVLVFPFSYETKNKKTPKDEWGDFIEKTYGSFANDPITRPNQGEYETRDMFE